MSRFANEIWMPVFEWEGIYEVSTRGRVRSCRTGNCLRPYIASGYERVAMSYRPGRPGGRYKIEGVHRLVLAAHTRMMPKGRNGLVCCHKNGDKRDNRLENLEWKSPLENMLDKNKHGTMPKGDTHKRRKLTAQQVLVIYNRAHCHENPITIAKDYGIHPGTVNAIMNKRTWKHLWEWNLEKIVASDSESKKEK